MDVLAAIIRETLLVTIVLCLPVLIVATGIGTIVAVVQAATQVQEQTLTLLPKICAVGAMLAMFGAYAMGRCAELFTHTIHLLPAIARTA